MAFVPGFDYDLFISYASVDNDPVPLSDSGWVEMLVRIMTSGSGLAGKLGRRDAFTWWIDKQSLRGNHEVNSHIPEQVRRSALMLVVLSPGYLASKFCRLELQAFLEAAKASDGRIFVVNREPIVEKLRAQVPDALRSLRKYEFWELDKRNKPRILGWPQPIASNVEDRAYYQKIDDVCEEIADQLEAMKLAEAVPKSQPAAVAAVPADSPGETGARAPIGAVPKAAPRPAVVLAETTDDLLRKRDEVRRYLDQCGIDVLPAGTYYGLQTADYETALSADLARSTAFVQLLGPEPGRTFADLPSGFGWLQYGVATRAAKPVLRWRNPDLVELASIEDPQHRELVSGADAMPFEEFKAKIRDAVLAPKLTPAKRASMFYFVNCDVVDVGEAEAIGKQLGNVDWERPEFEAKPKARQLQESIEASLTTCDGLLIVHGRSPQSWVRAQLQLYRKIRPKRTREPSVLAVVHSTDAPAMKGIGVSGLRFVTPKDLGRLIG